MWAGWGFWSSFLCPEGAGSRVRALLLASSSSLSLEADQRGAKSVGVEAAVAFGCRPDSASGLGRPWTR